MLPANQKPGLKITWNSVELRAWISDHIHLKLWDVITRLLNWRTDELLNATGNNVHDICYSPELIFICDIVLKANAAVFPSRNRIMHLVSSILGTWRPWSLFWERVSKFRKSAKSQTPTFFFNVCNVIYVLHGNDSDATLATVESEGCVLMYFITVTS